jgi:hypothetical protein
MAARVRHLHYRSVEEFFALDSDPHCLVNLLGPDREDRSLDARRRDTLDDLRARLRQWMVRVNDPALHAFDNRHEPETLARYVQEYRRRAAEEVEALKPYEERHGYRF